MEWEAWLVSDMCVCVRSLSLCCTICVSMRCLIPSHTHTHTQRRSQETQSKCVCVRVCVIVWHVQNAGRSLSNVQLFGHFVSVVELSLPHLPPCLCLSHSLPLALSRWRYLRSHLCICLYFVLVSASVSVRVLYLIV